jgi:hypothetical protein
VTELAQFLEPAQHRLSQKARFLSVLTKRKKHARQQSYQLSHPSSVIEKLGRSIDTWVLPTAFTVPNLQARKVSGRRHSLCTRINDPQTPWLPRSKWADSYKCQQCCKQARDRSSWPQKESHQLHVRALLHEKKESTK